MLVQEVVSRCSLMKRRPREYVVSLLARCLYTNNRSRRKNNNRCNTLSDTRIVKGVLRYNEWNDFGIKIIVNIARLI